MKIFQNLCVILGLFCFISEALAQVERADVKPIEVFAYILPDSLELAPEFSRGATVQQSDIRSQRLKTTLEAVRVNSIARSLPDWDEADSIAINDLGQRVRRPDSKQKLNDDEILCFFNDPLQTLARYL